MLREQKATPGVPEYFCALLTDKLLLRIPVQVWSGYSFSFYQKKKNSKNHHKIYRTVKAERPRYKFPINKVKKLSFLALLHLLLRQRGCWLWWMCLIAHTNQCNCTDASHHAPRQLPAMPHLHGNRQGKLNCLI